jgi:hypothetical protein
LRQSHWQPLRSKRLNIRNVSGIWWIGDQEIAWRFLSEPSHAVTNVNGRLVIRNGLGGLFSDLRFRVQQFRFFDAFGLTVLKAAGNNPKDRYKLKWQAILFYRGQDAPALDCPLTAEQWAVMEMNAPDGRLGNRYHAWQKPMELAERLIRHSTQPGDLVYDPFACTGTFLLAAAKLGRFAKGAELKPEHAAIAIERGCVYAE